MPIPISADVIIFTSFAPSPIASVVLFLENSLTNNTISAFCLGLTLHPINDLLDLIAENS